jgi:hypothetical protein
VWTIASYALTFIAGMAFGIPTAVYIGFIAMERWELRQDRPRRPIG